MSAILASIAALPPSTITLGAATVVSSYPFMFNVADYQRGVVALLNGRLGETYITPRAKVRSFSAYFGNAAVSITRDTLIQFWVVSSTTLASTLALTTAYLSPSPVVSQLALASGIFSAMQIPSTIALGIPKLFGPILDMDKTDELRDAKAGSPEADRADQLMKAWEKEHLKRFAVTGPALGLALLALMLDGREK